MKLICLKSLACIFCALIMSPPLLAQDTPACNRRPVHIGLIYPLSTNGLQAAEIKNGFSVHALIGVSYSEQSCVISGLAGIVKNDAHGVMISGLMNTSVEATGVHIAGLLNITTEIKGMQIAGLLNTAGTTEGLQISGLLNISKNVKGVQAAGLSNFSQSNSGLQISGLINTSKNVSSQVSGLINVAGKVKGVQIAGLINIAEESDFPIGLVNIIKKGEKQLGLSIDESRSVLLSFRSGGKYTYGIVSGGYNIREPILKYVIESGVGMHIPLSESLRLNAETTGSVLSDVWTIAAFKGTARVTGEWKVAKGFSLFAGPSVNYSGYDGNNGVNEHLRLWQFQQYGYQNQLYLGGIAGVCLTL